MCANYRPISKDLLKSFFAVSPPATEYKPESWPGYHAPIIRAGEGGERICELARFGLIPYWAQDTAIGRKTYNARSETAADKPSFRHAWRNAQFCLVPMEAFYEPSWESGKAVRWRIELANGDCFAVAALWERWKNRKTGVSELSFSMLTINSDAHPLMRKFHRPNSEKRMIAIVAPEKYDEWLHTNRGLAGGFLQEYPAEQMMARQEPKGA